ncbi:hypothetical protein D3C87_1336870 [compost metagenome]
MFPNLLALIGHELHNIYRRYRDNKYLHHYELLKVFGILGEVAACCEQHPFLDQLR